MFWLPLAIALLLAPAGPALAADWYVLSTATGQCVDITAYETDAGSPELATPEGTVSLYRSLGQTVVTSTVQDNAGASIIVLRIKDDEGNNVLNLTFFPSLADCQFVESHGRGN